MNIPSSRETTHPFSIEPGQGVSCVYSINAKLYWTMVVANSERSLQVRYPWVHSFSMGKIWTDVQS